MTPLEIFEKIKEAYETSTHNNNRFEAVLNSIKWDYTFYADEEFYFIKGDFKFFTPSLDPFNMKWSAMAVFEDGSSLAI